MYKRLLTWAIALVSFTVGHALSVTTTAGALASKVEDTSITTLVVTGTMDARDFKFIADSLNELTSINLSGVTIEAYSNATPAFGTINDYASQTIPRTAFFGKKLTSVTLPSKLVAIDYAAFAGCDGLTRITIPSTVTTIGDYAFAGSGLTTVTLSATVTTLGKGAFARCTSLTKAVVNAAPIGDFAFLGDVALTTVTLGAAVPRVGIGAFNGCTAIKTLTIGSGSALTQIDAEAFIASGVKTLNLSSMAVDSIGAWAFAQSSLNSITLPNNLSWIGEGAFAYATSLATISPSLSINQIPDYAFAGDVSLELSKLLATGVTTIGNYAFYNDSQQLMKMYLPSTISYMGNYAMAGMTGMLSLTTAAENVPELGDSVWAGVNQSIVPIVTPSKDCDTLYKAAEQWMEFMYDHNWDLGDVNHDGTVDVKDVTSLIAIILGTGTGCPICADVTEDAVIDVKDATALINMILSKAMIQSPSRIKAQLQQRMPATSDKLSIQDFIIKAGETRTVNVLLDNEEHDYTALQFTLTLPKGLTIEKAVMSNRAGSHQVMYMVQPDGKWATFICFSLGLENFAGQEGAVMTLTLTAADDFDAANSEMLIENAQLVTDQSEGYLADETLTRINDKSAVQDVNTGKEIDHVRYINVAGQESDVPFDGINIVVTTYTDGTTSTVKVRK